MLKRLTVGLSRDALMFGVGLAGVLHETLFTNLDRPNLLYTYVAMMSGAIILRSQAISKKASDTKGVENGK